MSSGNPNTTDRADKDSWDEALLGGNETKQDVSASFSYQTPSPIQSPKLIPEKKSPLLLPGVGMILALIISSGYFMVPNAMAFDWHKHFSRVTTGAEITLGVVADSYLSVESQVFSGIDGVTASVGSVFRGAGEVFDSVNETGINTVSVIDDLGASANQSIGDIFSYFGDWSESIQQKTVSGYFYLGEKVSDLFKTSSSGVIAFTESVKNYILLGVDFVDTQLKQANSFLRESKNASIKKAQNLTSTAATGVSDVASSTQKAIDDTKLAGESIVTKVNNFFSTTVGTVGNYWGRVVFRWRVFLGLEQSDTVVADGSGYTADDRAALQSVKAGVDEILRQLADRPIASSNVQSSVEPGGMVVVPSSGDANTDAVIKANIANMFSDEVVVNPDGTGRSGVITPVFRSGAGNDYLYILAPINN